MSINSGCEPTAVKVKAKATRLVGFTACLGEKGRLKVAIAGCATMRGRLRLAEGKPAAQDRGGMCTVRVRRARRSAQPVAKFRRRQDTAW
jgi:hypothetical protein